MDFESPVELIAFMATDSRSLEQKNSVYGALIGSAQQRGSGAELATAILWLGSWPWLSWILKKRRHLFVGCDEDLISELAELFTLEVARCDLRRVKQPAVTLLKNVDRDLVRRRLRQIKEERRLARLPDEEARADLPRDGRGWPPTTFVDQLASGRSLRIPGLRKIEADLLNRVLLLGETVSEAAAHLGLKADTAQKTLRRLEMRLSGATSGTGVTKVKGARRE